MFVAEVKGSGHDQLATCTHTTCPLAPSAAHPTAWMDQYTLLGCICVHGCSYNG